MKKKKVFLMVLLCLVVIGTGLLASCEDATSALAGFAICEECDGTGKKKIVNLNGDEIEMNCQACGGDGKLEYH